MTYLCLERSERNGEKYEGIQSAHRMNQSGGKNRLEQEAGEAAFLQGMSL